MQPKVEMRDVWTFEDLQALDVQDWWRYEIIDGALEIVSPGSVTMDRITKPAQYAAAGIPAYWRMETDPRIATPFPVQVEVDRLL